MVNKLKNQAPDNKKSNVTLEKNADVNLWIAGIISFLVGALFFGGVVFAWQKSKLEKIEASKNKKIQNLEEQISLLQTQINNLEKEPDQDQDNSGSGQIPSSWKTYRNEEYGYELKYPSDWTYRNEEYKYGLDDGLTVVFSSSNEGGGMTINHPIPEIGYEASILESEERVSVSGSEKKLTEKVFRAKSDTEFNDLILVQWNMDNWENSGEIKLGFQSNEDPRLKELDRILKSFRFIE